MSDQWHDNRKYLESEVARLEVRVRELEEAVGGLRALADRWRQRANYLRASSPRADYWCDAAVRQRAGAGVLDGIAADIEQLIVRLEAKP